MFDDEIYESPGMTRARRHVARAVFEDVEFAMTGDKILVDVKIPLEVLRRCSPEQLAEIVRKGINRTRVVADYEAALLYNELTGLQDLLAELPADDIDPAEIDERCRLVPELVAGIHSLLSLESWTTEELAGRSGIDPQILADLLGFGYAPFEAIRGRRDLIGTMDLARPVAEAFGVSPQILWKKGIARLKKIERWKRRRIKQGLRAVKLHRKGRKPDRARLAGLELGNLEEAGVMADMELETLIKTEYLYDRSCGRRPFMAWPESQKERTEADYGPLLLGGAGVLRKKLVGDEYRKLMALDRKARKVPESVTRKELRWVRKLLGTPALEVIASPPPRQKPSAVEAVRQAAAGRSRS